MTKNYPNRRSIRLRGYDYSQPGLYFITICTYKRKHIFGHIENNEMILNNAGKIARDCWLETINIRLNITLGEFVVMPNHFHAVLQIDYAGRDKLHLSDRDKPHSSGMNKSHLSGRDKLHLSGMNKSHSADNNNNNNPDLSEDNVIWIDNKGKKIAGIRITGIWIEDEEIVDNRVEGENMPCENISGENISGECNSPLRGTSQTVGAIVRGYKSMVTKQLGYSPWQRNYYDHIIRNQRAYDYISQYIVDNPARWEKDCFY